MSEMLLLECPSCGEEKHMVKEDYGYREENQIGIKCVNCNVRSKTREWEEIKNHH